MKVAPKLLGKKKRVVDLSADYRLKSPQAYKAHYKAVHTDKKNLKTAVYGMPELYRKDIAGAHLVANPGCYPTAVILGLAPLCKKRLIETDGIFIDAKSSITGAGRKAHIDYHYAHIDGNIWAYKAFVHQHVPEMAQALKSISLRDVSLRFIPHVVGVHSGIYATIFTRLAKKTTAGQITALYRKFYAQAPFVRIRDGFPKLSDVVGTNFCDIGIACDEKNRHCVITAAIDNLIKGAAGTAVQNMNIMLGMDQKQGLT
jgi:N-acetyl-gamma-glutamyl-phosphate reductase